MVRNALQSLWDEPRVPDPPPRDWRDWALVGVLAPVAFTEAVFTAEVVWLPVALVLAIGPLFTLLWRRTHPLVAVTIAFSAHAAIHTLPIFGHHGEEGLYATAFVLILPYSLLRWGSGRESAIGIAVMLTTHALTWSHLEPDLAEIVFGTGFLLLPAALGASVRYRSAGRVRELDQVKLREREQLARELHDTVAHHVSAIAIQAQAGRTVAATDPAAAMEALAVIEAEASRTLDEMRTMVGALRQGEEPDLSPQAGVADIERLARAAGDSPKVEVELSGDLDNLTPAIDAAIYRLAQESITNALRHARRASRVTVSVAGDPDCVRLTVTDDGEAGAFSGATPGYGIVGMTERATLLHGTLHAGPGHHRGWTVAAELPRSGVPV